MSSFSKADLFKLYDRYVNKFSELALIAQESGIDLNVTVDSTGTITFSSSDWFTDKGKKVLRKHEIVHGKDRAEENSKTFVYDN